MTCAACVRRIERALSKVDGVRDAAVNLATETARVTYDPAIASTDLLRAAVEKAGYNVGAIASATELAPPTAPAAVVAEASLPVDETDWRDAERQREIDDPG